MTVANVFPVSFHLPALAHRLPWQFHPDTEKLMDSIGDWAQRALREVIPDPAAIARNVDGTRLLCLSIPHADTELAAMGSRLMNYLIAIENSLVDKGALGGSSFATRLVFGTLMADLIGWGDHRTPMHDDFQWLRQRMPPSRWRRFVSYMEDFAAGFTTELETWRDAEVVDVPSYLRDRRHSLGVRWMLALAEEGLPGPELPGEFFAHPDTIALHDTVIDGYTLLNDVVSYRKELASGDRVNLLYFLREHEKLTLQHAMNRMCELIDATEQQFIDLRDRIMAGSWARHPTLRAYLDETGHLMTSNLWWAAHSIRYEPRGLAWDGTAAGTLTYHATHTDFMPNTIR